MSLVNPLFFPFSATMIGSWRWRLLHHLVLVGMGTAFPLVSQRRNGKSQLRSNGAPACFHSALFNYDVDISQHLATSVRSHKPLALSECAQRSSFILKGLASWCVSWQLFCLVCERLVAEMFQAFAEIWSRSALYAQSCYLLLQYV